MGSWSEFVNFHQPTTRNDEQNNLDLSVLLQDVRSDLGGLKMFVKRMQGVRSR